MNNAKSILLAPLLTMSLFGCVGQEHRSTLDDELALSLQDLVSQTIKKRSTDKENPLYGVVLHVEAPKLGIDWSGSAGTTDHSLSASITPEHPFRIASNTKTFVAAAVLRLSEQRRIDLDASIGNYIHESHRQMMLNDGYDVDSITPRHLLTHTSGLFDYADTKMYEEQITDHPDRHWSRTEQLAAAMRWGDAYGKPGEVYRYSDTGYILLGEIVERITGETLGPALRELINYEEIGLTSTWLETMEEKPSGARTRAHQYLGKLDFFDYDPSFDLYGGGGLVSTVGDLARFYRGLFAGDVFDKVSTIDTLLSTVDVERGGPISYGAFEQVPGVYRMGIKVTEVEGRTVYGHAGYFGTYVGYVPSLDLVISMVLTQHFVRDEKKKIFRDALILVSEAAEDHERYGDL